MDFREILYLHVYRRDTPNLVKIGENLGLLLEYLSTLVLVLQHDKSEHFYILDCYVYVTNNTSNVLLSFHSNNGNANAPPFYVIRTLPVLLSIKR